MILEILFYLGFAVALGLAIWLSHKYRVQKAEILSLVDILALMKFVNRQFNYPQQDDLERVLSYLAELANYLVPYVEKGDYSSGYLIDRISSDALEFCEEHDISVDVEFATIINNTVEYIVKVWFGIE
jgi:hypothetical protein